MPLVLHGEPAWLRERRAEGEAAFERLEPPFPDRTDLTHIDYEAFGGQGEAPAPALQGVPASGVIFCPLETAVRDHGELVRRHLFSQVGPQEGKFEALHAARLGEGAFLYVPAGVEIPEPLEVVWPAAPAGSTYAPHTLVVLEKAASATVIQRTAEGSPAEALVSSAVETVVGDGARLRFVDLQTWGRGVTNLAARRGELGRDAGLEWVVAELGGQTTRSWTTSVLRGTGSEARSILVFFGTGSQHMDVSLILVHHGARTIGNMIAKGALKDTARSVYRGMSDIKSGAKFSDSQQKENTLHLTDGVRSDAIPSLFIDEYELAAGHAATVGKVDEEQLFYLRSRGLPEREALRLVVHGFFAPIFDLVPVESVREALRRLVDRKLDEGL